MSAQHFPDELEEAMASSFRRVTALRQEQERLAAEMREAVAQVIARIGTAHRAGELTDAEVCTAFLRLRDEQQPGVTELWDGLVDLPWRRVVALAKQLPNTSDGDWVGHYPFPADCAAPPPETPVVYVLYGADTMPVYIGSTDRFRARMADHRRDGKEFVHWWAIPCSSREQAYRVEDRMLRQFMPPLNIKAGR
ncbi:GIY-YIG nuclease family protein [Streptomyces mirabilis]|uniref:GIY-YIG nuclease family protein n=1 Tax=Streptomyces mirabilis TaxID=68239 RepID=UPI00380914F6